jgi:hypothetical protein
LGVVEIEPLPAPRGSSSILPLRPLVVTGKRSFIEMF